MTKPSDNELQKSEEWDFDRAESEPGVSAGRTVVSVSLSRVDYRRIAKHAQGIGLRTSEFIRRAVLNEVAGREGVIIYSASSGPGSMIFSSTPVPTTDVWGQIEQELRQPETPDQGVLAL